MLKTNRDWTATFNGKTYEGKAGEKLGEVPDALLSSLKQAQIVSSEPPAKKGKKND